MILPVCCARAASGHAAAPPSSVMNWRRFIRSPRRRNFEAEYLSGGKVDDEIELDRLLDREIARLCPAQNLVDIVGGAPELVRDVCTIGHQTSRFDELPVIVDRRQSRALRQGDDANPVGGHERVAKNIERIRATL